MDIFSCKINFFIKNRDFYKKKFVHSGILSYKNLAKNNQNFGKRMMNKKIDSKNNIFLNFHPCFYNKSNCYNNHNNGHQ